MNNTYGYARCSTNESHQDINRQIRELKNLGVTDVSKIYWEYESGIKNDRVELTKLFGVIRAGDTLATTEVSRLTRSTQYLCEILKDIQEKKIRLLIGSFVIDCRFEEIDPMTKGMLMLLGVFSEMERDMIAKRVKSGMENAKAKGKKIGRPKLTKDALPFKFWKYYDMFQSKQINLTEFVNLMNASRTTIYKYLSIAKNNTEGESANDK